MKTNETRIPGILKQGDAIGELSITLNLNSQPSFFYTLISKASLKNKTKNNDKITINGTVFRVLNAVENIDPVTGVHILTVNGEGWFRPILEKEFIVPPGDISLAKIGGLVGVTIINGGIQKNVEEEYITTLGSEIETYRQEHGLVVVYEGNRIVLTELGKNGGISISENNIIGEVTYNHKDEHTHDYIMLPQYVEIELDSTEEESDELKSKPTFDKIPEINRTDTNDPDNAAIPPVRGQILTLDMNFDMSGDRKTMEKTTYTGDRVVLKSVTTYGFAYTTDVVGSRGENDSNEFIGYYQTYWKPIERYNIEYLYDDGYYIGYNKIGYKLDRFEQETEEFELLEASFNKDAEVQLEAQQYKFRAIPIYEYERLDLDAFYNYYKDALPSVDEYFISYDEYDEKTKKTITKYTENKAYVTPMFISRKAMYSRCYDWIPVPPTIAEYKNQIKTAGEERKELYVVKIKQSKNTRITYTDGERNTSQNIGQIEDSYIEYHETSAAQDANFKNHIQQSTSNFVNGRPGIAEHTPNTILDTPVKNGSIKDDSKNKFRKIVSSGVTDSSIEPKGTITIRGAKTEEEVIAKLQKKINNERVYYGDEFTLTTFINANLNANGKIRGRIKGQSLVGVATSVTHKYKITGSKVTCEGETIINGVLFSDAPVKLKVKTEENKDYNEDNTVIERFITIPYKKEHVSEIGPLLSFLPKRGTK